jgi:hypothetical protein
LCIFLTLLHMMVTEENTFPLHNLKSCVPELLLNFVSRCINWMQQYWGYVSIWLFLAQQYSPFHSISVSVGLYCCVVQRETNIPLKCQTVWELHSSKSQKIVLYVVTSENLNPNHYISLIYGAGGNGLH